MTRIDKRIPVNCCECNTDYAPKQGGAKVAKDGLPKTPKGWSRYGDGFLCRNCRNSRYMSRTIRCEVASVAESEARQWGEFVTAAYAASQQCKRFANWYWARLFAADPATDPSTWTTKTSKKTGKELTVLPSLPDVPWYRATKIFTDVSPSVLVQLSQQVRGVYCTDRWEVLVSNERTVRCCRRKTLTIPCPSQRWKLVTLPDGRFGVTLAVGPGKSWALRLTVDAYNREYLKQLVAGEAMQRGTANLKLVSRERRSGESAEPVKRWTLFVAGMFARPNTKRKKAATRTLTLGHDAKCLWVGSLLDDDSGELWEFPAVRLRERLTSHGMRDRRKQIDNSQMPRRLSKRAMRRLKQARTGHCDRHAEFVDKESEQQIAALVRRCVAAGVDCVEYEITDRGWTPHFPWRRLRDKLAIALENEGIALHVLDYGEPITASAEPTGEMEAAV